LYGGPTLGSTAGVAFGRTYALHVQIGLHFATLLGSRLPDAPQLAALSFGLSF
jgi:hypothetical protein